MVERCFHVMAARAWNSLPTSVTTATSLVSLKTTKNISFHKVVPGILVCVPCPTHTFAYATLICTFLTKKMSTTTGVWLLAYLIVPWPVLLRQQFLIIR